MDRLDHLEHLDRHLVDELAQVARETVRDELREQTRKQRRKAVLYAASGTVALYAGAALALAVGLALAIALPDWAAALITAAILGVVAYLLRGAARPTASAHAHDTGFATSGRPGAAGTRPPKPPGAADLSYPPMPPVAPRAGAPDPRPAGTRTASPRSDDGDSEQPRPRA
ncbi:phage holin family protein [Streptomyces sp. NPDC050997]|uniref:phage holin family protein n=1 Tax=Streptomyces sp. NPDC050997 TaxID=3155519 RepID=UPI00342077D1